MPITYFIPHFSAIFRWLSPNPLCFQLSFCFFAGVYTLSSHVSYTKPCLRRSSLYSPTLTFKGIFWYYHLIIITFWALFHYFWDYPLKVRHILCSRNTCKLSLFALIMGKYPNLQQDFFNKPSLSVCILLLLGYNPCSVYTLNRLRPPSKPFLLLHMASIYRLYLSVNLLSLIFLMIFMVPNPQLFGYVYLLVRLLLPVYQAFLDPQTHAFKDFFMAFFLQFCANFFCVFS